MYVALDIVFYVLESSRKAATYNKSATYRVKRKNASGGLGPTRCTWCANRTMPNKLDALGA